VRVLAFDAEHPAACASGAPLRKDKQVAPSSRAEWADSLLDGMDALTIEEMYDAQQSLFASGRCRLGDDTNENKPLQATCGKS
jgi:hypothetical protein